MACELAKFSPRDAVAYDTFNAHLEALARKLAVNVYEPPPTLAELFARLPDAASEETFAKFMFGSIASILDEWFESDEIKAILATLAVMSNFVGASSPGSALQLLRRPMSLLSSSVTASHDPRKQVLRGSTGLPVGGMGAIPAAMARSLQASGGQIRTNAAVTAVESDGKVFGVRLEDNEVLTSSIVLSNLNPKTTFLDLIGPDCLDKDFARRVAGIDMRGSIFKVGLALNDLPRWSAAESDEQARLFASCQFRVAPSIAYLDRAFNDAVEGAWSSEPVMWGLIPSATDPSLAPSGKHVMSINIFHAPYRLRESSWNVERDRMGRRCVEVLGRYVQNLDSIITDVRYWSPEDIASEFGLVEANIAHGDSTPSHMFSLRPLSGWSHYRTPIHGLYLCGSGAWPGGFVSGLPGHNASQAVLRDLASGKCRLERWSRPSQARKAQA
jgi:phytoene dehydrogenase-like protein